MKILIINTKGGTGKSTIAMQVIAPYLYEKNGKNPIDLFIFDPQNNESDYISKSKIIGSIGLFNKDSEIGKVTNYDIIERFSKAIANSKQAVVDVGANQSTDDFTNKVLVGNGMIEHFDLVIIPLKSGAGDLKNALQTFSSLSSLSDNIKIIFALNDCKEYLYRQFYRFFNDPLGVTDNKNLQNENTLNNLKTSIKYKENYKGFITLLNRSEIMISLDYGMTMYEIAQPESHFISKDEDDTSIHYFMKLTTLSSCRDFANSEFKFISKALDNILESKVVEPVNNKGYIYYE